MVEKAGETNVEPLRLHTHGSVELEVDSGGQMAGTEAAEALTTGDGAGPLGPSVLEIWLRGAGATIC